MRIDAYKTDRQTLYTHKQREIGSREIGTQDPNLLPATCPKVYIGQTGRTLEHRIKEHKSSLTSGNVSQLAVAEHAVDESHTIKWEGADVVTIIYVTGRDVL